MSIALGVFSDRERAVETIEGLRRARFDADRVRLIGGSHGVGELAGVAGAGTNIAAGPAAAVLEGLVGAGLGERQLVDLERRIQDGAVIVLGEDLDDEAQEQFAAHLREHGAEDVTLATTSAS